MANIKVLKIECSEFDAAGYAITRDDVQYIISEMMGYESDYLDLRPFTISISVVEMDEEEYANLEPYGDVL